VFIVYQYCLVIKYLSFVCYCHSTTVISICHLYVTVIVLPFSFTNFPSGKTSSLCCMVIGYSICVVNINIVVLHTDRCENNMQEVWVFGL